MSPAPDPTPTARAAQSKRDRREEAREKSRIARENAAKKKRRNRIFVQGGLVVGVLAVAAVVVLVIVNSMAPAAAGPKNMASGGILLKGDKTTGAITAATNAGIPKGGSPTPTDQTKLTSTTNISIYLDYLCPYCNQFETTNASQISTWLKDGAVTYEIHPIAILDGSSLGTKYSTRAANAAACVANYDPNDFLAVNTSFYANQPTEGTAGLTNAELLALMKTAGASSSKITSCVNDGAFDSFVASSTSRALSDKLPNSSVAKLTGTPTVIVNGKQYSGSLTDASTFASFVSSVSSS